MPRSYSKWNCWPRTNGARLAFNAQTFSADAHYSFLAPLCARNISRALLASIPQSSARNIAESYFGHRLREASAHSAFARETRATRNSVKEDRS